MKKKLLKEFIVIVGLTFGIFIFVIFIVGRVGAHENYYCGEYNQCKPTPTPTAVPCPGVDVIQWEEDKEPCVTPTVTPTSTPSAMPTPEVTSTPSTVAQPAPPPAAATCNIAFDNPLLYGFKLEGNGSVTFTWFDAQSVDKFSIIYGYSPDSLIYGEDNIPSSSRSITLNGLTPGKSVFAIVGAWRNRCEMESNILDPKVK